MLTLRYSDFDLEIGCDEAGRGCLAGPVVAAAVILDPANPIEGLNDSKKLSESKRVALAKEVQAKARYFAVAEVSSNEIDEINILNASFLAMHRAIDDCGIQPELILVDGNRFNAYNQIPHECIIKGDGKVACIAAASILAKTHRDNLMKIFGSQYPGYGWETNAGYPTKKHRDAIAELGVTPLHRTSFQLLPAQLDLFK